MIEQLIKYETAILAKEVGLIPELDRAWNLIGYNLKNIKEKIPTTYHVHSSFPNQSEFLYAPTLSGLQKWLRETHNIIVWANPIRFGDYYTENGIHIPPYIKYEYKLFMVNKSFKENTTNFYDSYEEALEAGEIVALNLIKNNKINEI